jgi:hypothetical protein
MPTSQANDDASDPGPDVTCRKLLASLLGSDLWSFGWVRGPCFRTATVEAGSTPRGRRPQFGVAGWLSHPAVSAHSKEWLSTTNLTADDRTGVATAVMNCCFE